MVLDRDGGRVHQLNSTASYVWERCDGRSTQSEIADEMAAEYGVEPDQAVADVAALMAQFRELGLLVESSS